MNKYVITAAGGNATAIGVIDSPQDRTWYEQQGMLLMKEFSDLHVEQVGFVVLSQNHFEMSGGELCGNGTRAAGFLFAKLTGGADEYEFSTSGHTGLVNVKISDADTSTPYVIGVFPNLSAKTKPVNVTGVEKAELVDLGGIVHVVIYGEMPENYTDEHRRITSELGLTERDAVGVDWISIDQDGTGIAIHPVVWVRSIDTYFYESSCGSGSISVALATGINTVKQPSGEVIVVAKQGEVLTIASKLEVVHES